jgi:hypothetical protein
VPRSIAGLRKLVLCAQRGTTGVAIVTNRIKPIRKPLFLDDLSVLLYDLFAKRCDALVFDAPTLGVLRREAPDSYDRWSGGSRPESGTRSRSRREVRCGRASMPSSGRSPPTARSRGSADAGWARTRRCFRSCAETT